MMNRARRCRGVAVLAGLALSLTACATNPATGRKQIMLISEQQEIELGLQADKEVVQSMGLYSDPELEQYVQELGLRLARGSERPELPWSFRVIDDPVVNAFALPGGYIYITRGILGYLGSEAQLVTVLGHEIGHVTARHSASQISKQQLTGIGLGVGMILEPGMASFGDLLQMGAGLMFLKFSRDDERQADDLGLRYGLGSGYDLSEAPEVFVSLKRVSELAEAGRIPGWLSTHPDPENRIERIEQQLSTRRAELQGARVGRADYMRQIDGMVFGENPREGFFEGSDFLHPDLRFRVDFPEGWTLRNQRQAVTALSSEKDAAVVLSLTDQPDPQTAAARFARQSGVEAERSRSGRINGLPAVWTSFEAQSGETQLRGRVAHVLHDERTYQLLAYTVASRWGGYEAAFDRTLGSFAELRDRRALAVQPARLEIVELPRAMSLRQFHQAYPSSIDVERLAVVNQCEEDTRFERGALVKRVVGGQTAGR